MFSEFFGPKWWEGFRVAPGAFEQFAAHACSRAMLDCFQIRAKGLGHPWVAGDVHIQTQQELREYHVTEVSQLANDRLAKLLAVHTSKWENVDWDLEAFGVPISIHGDSFLVVSWYQGYWQVIMRISSGELTGLLTTSTVCLLCSTRVPLLLVAI
eukprot:1934387-Pyramimonas_sp.AAC.1